MGDALPAPLTDDATQRPRIFFVSSQEGLNELEALAQLVVRDDWALMRLWPVEYKLGQSYLESLLEASLTVDYAVVLWTPDLEATARMQTQLLPRANVILEFGLFLGALGRRRVVLAHPAVGVHIPTDYAGYENYGYRRSDANPPGHYLQNVALKIRRYLQEDWGDGQRHPPYSEPPPVKVQETAYCIQVTLKKPSRRKKVEANKVAEGLPDKVIHIQKDLYDNARFKPVSAVDLKIRKVLDDYCVPSPLGRGIWLVPELLGPAIEKSLTKLFERRQGAVDELVTAFPEIKKDAKQELREWYDEEDYPSPKQFKDAFEADSRLFTFGVPDELKDSDPHLYQIERDKLDQSWEECAWSVQLFLRSRFQAYVGRLVDNLEPNDHGKHRIYLSSVENLHRFWAVFDRRDVTNDDALSKVVHHLDPVFEGADVAKMTKQLRKDETKREQTLAYLRSMKNSLDQLVEERPSTRS